MVVSQAGGDNGQSADSKAGRKNDSLGGKCVFENFGGAAGGKFDFFVDEFALRAPRDDFVTMPESTN